MRITIYYRLNADSLDQMSSSILDLFTTGITSTLLFDRGYYKDSNDQKTKRKRQHNTGDLNAAYNTCREKLGRIEIFSSDHQRATNSSADGSVGK